MLTKLETTREVIMAMLQQTSKQNRPEESNALEIVYNLVLDAQLKHINGKRLVPWETEK